MSIDALINELRAKGVQVLLEGDRPKLIGPKGVLTADLVAELRRRRAEIIQALSRDRQAATDAAPGRPCYSCGGVRYWQRPTGGWCCSQCHPAPDDTLPEVIVLRDLRDTLRRAVLELAEAAGWPRLPLDAYRTVTGARPAWVAFSRTADVPTLRLAIEKLREVIE